VEGAVSYFEIVVESGNTVKTEQKDLMLFTVNFIAQNICYVN
jgi:hypothetical protein